jgi:hypothetical protein
MRPGPAILVTRVRWRGRQGLATLVLFAFGAALLDGVSVPF